MKIETILKNTKVSQLSRREPLLVPPASPIREVMRQLAERKLGCALVQHKGQLLGIITERDVLSKVAGGGVPLDTPVEALMTPRPKALKLSQSVGAAIKLMNQGHYRHLPLLDEQGKVAGFVGAKDLVRFLASFFPFEVYNLPPDPRLISTAPEGA